MKRLEVFLHRSTSFHLTQFSSLPQGRKNDEDKLYGKNEAGTEPQSPTRSPLAQGHIQEPRSDVEGPGTNISAPAELTGMTGQYITGRDANPISEQSVVAFSNLMTCCFVLMAGIFKGTQKAWNRHRSRLSDYGFWCSRRAASLRRAASVHRAAFLNLISHYK